MPKIVVQVYEIRENGQGVREEVRVEDIDKWTLTYEDNITIAQLAYRIESNFPRYYPNLPLLNIKYLKDAPSGSYDGGILSKEDYACNVFAKQDMVRVYRLPPTSQAGKGTPVRFGSVAPDSCAARPSKRVINGNNLYPSRVFEPLPPQVKRRRINPDEPLSTLETDHEPLLEIRGDKSILVDEPVVVMDSQRFPAHNTNMYGTPESFSAQDIASKNLPTSFRDFSSSQVRSNGQNALGERPVGNASTPKSESPDPDGNLVYSVPASDGGTPITTKSSHDQFVRPSLPSAESRSHRQDGAGKTALAPAGKDSEHNLSKLSAQLKTPRGAVKPQRVSSARALSGKLWDGKRSIFEGPYGPDDDIEESSQTALKRGDAPSKDRQYSSSSISSAPKKVNENAGEASDNRENESESVSEVSQRASSTLSAPQAQARIRRKFRDPDQIHTRVTHMPDGSQDSRSISGVKKQKLISDQWHSALPKDADLQNGLSAKPETTNRKQHDRLPKPRTEETQAWRVEHNLKESLQKEADSIGLKSTQRHTSEFSTAPIPSSRSDRKRCIIADSSTAKNTPSSLPTDVENFNRESSASISVPDKDAVVDAHGLLKSPLPRSANRVNTLGTSSHATIKMPYKKSSTPNFSRANFFESFFDNFDKVVVPQEFVELRKGNNGVLSSVKQEALSSKSTTPDLTVSAKPLVKRPSKPAGGKASTIPATKTPIPEYEESDHDSSIAGSSQNQEDAESIMKVESNISSEPKESYCKDPGEVDEEEAQDRVSSDESEENANFSGERANEDSVSEELDKTEPLTASRCDTNRGPKDDYPSDTLGHGSKIELRAESHSFAKVDSSDLDASDSESGTEDNERAHQIFVPTLKNFDTIATALRGSKKERQEQTITKSTVSTADAVQLQDDPDGSESSEESSSGSDEEPSLPILKGTHDLAPARLSNYDASMMDEAERQLQREATQSMDTLNSTQSDRKASLAAVEVMKDLSSQKKTTPASISKPVSSKSLFPSFTDLKNHGNLYNSKNPPFKNPVKMPSTLNGPNDSSDDDNTDSDSDSSDDDLDAGVSAKNTKVTVSSGGKGRYHRLIHAVNKHKDR